MAIGVADVRRIFDTKMQDVEIESFLSTARLVVDEDLTNVGHSSARLDVITSYLAAHYLSVTDELGNITEVTVGESTTRMDNGQRDAVGKGLSLTRFGQQAISLDTSGILGAKYSGTANKFGFRARLTLV